MRLSGLSKVRVVHSAGSIFFNALSLATFPLFIPSYLTPLLTYTLLRIQIQFYPESKNFHVIILDGKNYGE